MTRITASRHRSLGGRRRNKVSLSRSSALRQDQLHLVGRVLIPIGSIIALISLSGPWVLSGSQPLFLGLQTGISGVTSLALALAILALLASDPFVIQGILALLGLSLGPLLVLGLVLGSSPRCDLLCVGLGPGWYAATVGFSLSAAGAFLAHGLSRTETH